MTGFFVPKGPEIALIANYGSAQGMPEPIRIDLVSPFILESEIVYASKAFGSRDTTLMHNNCDLGWLFVTSQKILFWSDESKKPHIAVNFDSLQGVKSSWAIMRQRKVEVTVDGLTVKFGTHKDAAQLIEKLFNQSRTR